MSPMVPTKWVADASLPAGDGWCEAIIRPRPIDNELGDRRCFTKGRFEREGHRVCGLHLRSMTVRFWLDPCPRCGHGIEDEHGDIGGEWWCAECDTPCDPACGGDDRGREGTEHELG